MRPSILLRIALTLLAAPSLPGCRQPAVAPEDPALVSELKLLERQVAGLKEAIRDAKKGELFSQNAIAIGVSEAVVQAGVAQALPIQAAVSPEFSARIDRVSVSFRSMQGSVTLAGRVWAIADPGTYADLVLLGGIHQVDIDRETGVLRAQIALDGFEVKRAAAAGMEFEWTKSLVRMLGDRGLGALRELVPDVRIPVGIERGIELPGVSGGAITIPSGRLPLEAAVARVLPLSGRLWAMIEVKTTGWERPGSGPLDPRKTP
jgi:hypothetical protein